jgi:hypothetical protein
MTYSVGNSEVANYANTSSGKVTNVVADNGVGGSGESVNVVDRAQLSFVVATNIQFLTVDVTSLSGYIAGKSDITITVNAGVYVYGSVPTQRYPSPGAFTPITQINNLIASMQILGGAVGDTIKLVNNGYIVGYGGDGGAVTYFEDACSSLNYVYSGASKGNAALSFVTPGISLAIENNGYIAGGGGGGGSGSTLDGVNFPGGGGGSGGGVSGAPGQIFNTTGFNNSRATPPNVGFDGVMQQFDYSCNAARYVGGGGGGFVFPGTGGITGTGAVGYKLGVGGGSGGSGGGVNLTASSFAFNNNGGSANNAAPTFTTATNICQGGGGGGWGAAGANGYDGTSLAYLGAVGGNSIVTNGNAYTLTGSGTLYGSVDTALRSIVYTFSTSNYFGTYLNFVEIPGYIAGLNVVLIVPANVILTTDGSSSVYGLQLLSTGANPVSLRIVINGAILGSAGVGSNEINTGSVGGDAIGLPATSPYNIIIDNDNGYLAGGGGGGGRTFDGASTSVSTIVGYGGGGAGFKGSSGTLSSAAYNPGVTNPNLSGSNGTVVVGPVTYMSGGSGGTILPGAYTDNIGTFVNNKFAGKGGTAGGSGSFYLTGTVTDPFNRGGGFALNGASATILSGGAGGGGGGWGGSGGAGRRANTIIQSGRTGGRAVKILDGSSRVFVVNPSRMAGTVAI